MATTRLTKTLRNEIHHALMERAYTERREEIVLMEHELGMAVYNDTYSSKDQALMEQLPEEYFLKLHIIRASFNENYYHFSLLEPVSVGNLHSNLWTAFVNYPAEHKLTDTFVRFRKMKEEYDRDRQRLSAESSSILESCMTVKKLIEAWPEIEPLLQKLNIHATQSKEVFLPAIRQDMNALFYLPPDLEDQANQALAA